MFAIFLISIKQLILYLLNYSPMTNISYILSTHSYSCSHMYTYCNCCYVHLHRASCLLYFSSQSSNWYSTCWIIHQWPIYHVFYLLIHIHSHIHIIYIWASCVLYYSPKSYLIVDQNDHLNELIEPNHVRIYLVLWMIKKSNSPDCCQW